MPSSLQKVQNSERTLSNGTRVAQFRINKADGSVGVVTRIVGSSPAIAAAARAAKTATITQAQAQAAFDRFYGRTKVTRRGTIAKRFVSPRGRKSARTYDLNTSARVIADRRYLTPAGPYRYDFAGVDAGSRARKVGTEAQLARLAAGRLRRGTAEGKAHHAATRTSRVAKPKAKKSASAKSCKPCKHQKGGVQHAGAQVAGYWW